MSPSTPSNRKRRKPHPLSRLPPWISHFLGYRRPPPPSSIPPHYTQTSKRLSLHLTIQKREPWYAVYIWSFVGSFCGLAVLQAIFTKTEYFARKGVIGIVGSYGATSVLTSSTLTSPLAQPSPPPSPNPAPSSSPTSSPP